MLVVTSSLNLSAVCIRIGQVCIRIGQMLPATASRACCCALQVDVRDKWQFTPLHSAANGGHVSTIRKLIQFSHDVDVKDYLGKQRASSIRYDSITRSACTPAVIATRRAVCQAQTTQLFAYTLQGELHSIMQPCMAAWVPLKPWWRPERL